MSEDSRFVSNDDTDASATSLELAAFLRSAMDEIVSYARTLYGAEYTHSVGGGLSTETSVNWTRSVVLELIGQLETGLVDAHLYRRCRGGDMVIQKNALFAPLATFVETRLFFGEAIAPVLWRHYIGDPEKFGDMQVCLERCIQSSVRANTEAFLDAICEEDALSSSWDHRPGLSVESVASPGAPVADGPSAGLFSGSPTPSSAGGEGEALALTRRERQIADLVAAGKTNSEIADRLGIKTSTVKNQLTHIFDKLNVYSRTELAVRLLGGRP